MARTIVITGCSTGFGRDAALRYARRGDRVDATMRGVDGRNASKAAALRAEAAGGSLSVVELDACDTASVEAAAKVVLNDAGAPDVVLDNERVMHVGTTEAFEPDEFTAQLDVNVAGVHRRRLGTRTDGRTPTPRCSPRR